VLRSARGRPPRAQPNCARCAKRTARANPVPAPRCCQWSSGRESTPELLLVLSRASGGAGSRSGRIHQFRPWTPDHHDPDHPTDHSHVPLQSVMAPELEGRFQIARGLEANHSGLRDSNTSRTAPFFRPQRLPLQQAWQKVQSCRSRRWGLPGVLYEAASSGRVRRHSLRRIELAEVA